jgi:hypothetical protein
MTTVTNQLHNILALPMHNLLSEQAEQYTIDLSVQALFNGIIMTELPDNDAWTKSTKPTKAVTKLSKC